MSALRCDDLSERRAKARERHLNGIDYVEVDSDQPQLIATFLGQAPDAIEPANIRIEGGRPVRVVGVSVARYADPTRDDAVRITLDGRGDASNYTLTLVGLEDFDPRYASAAFSFAGAAFFPILVLGVFWRRANAAGALAGVVVGTAVTAYYMATAHPVLRSALGIPGPAALWWGVQPISAGLFGVPAAFAATVAVSLLTRASPQAQARSSETSCSRPGSRPSPERPSYEWPRQSSNCAAGV